MIFRKHHSFRPKSKVMFYAKTKQKNKNFRENRKLSFFVPKLDNEDFPQKSQTHIFIKIDESSFTQETQKRVSR